MHYYQFNIGDYTSHTKGLSVIEDIAYRRIIDDYFLSEQPLIGCSADVARVIGMREYNAEVEYVLNRFFVNQDGKWLHTRIEKDIAAYRKQLANKSKAGIESGKARRNKEVEHPLNTCSTPVEHNVDSVEQTSNQEPGTKNQEPDKNHTQKPAVTACPVEQIIQLYRDTARRLPSVRIVPDSVKAHIRARWLQDKRFQSLEFWRGFFEYCENNKFLSGQSETRGDRKPFRASLAWVVNATNFAKIINEDYA